MAGNFLRLSGLVASLTAAVLSLGCEIPPQVEALWLPSREELMITALNGTAGNDRRWALAHLIKRPAPWMRDDAEFILKADPDASCRALAAEILGELGDPASVQALRGCARNDSHWVVRQEALESLGLLLRADVAEDLEYALAHDAETQVRATALSIAYVHLAEQRRDTLLKMLDQALASTNPAAVRMRASDLMSLLTGLSAPPDRQRWRAVLRENAGQPDNGGGH